MAVAPDSFFKNRITSSPMIPPDRALPAAIAAAVTP
jgi:hypothetical protein